jgi:hypothetical protein
MTNSSGNLSVDFLVGFTIFMVAFIWVATLVPNLFLGISSHGIDYDAVAYRTGVILAEDPGATIPIVTTPWEVQPDSGTENIERFGLAISKETPNILSETKVNRFFCSTVFSYPEDYRKRAIFGDYPYRFNISLRVVGDNESRYVGDTLPENYGYIRRDVKIRQFSNATIDKGVIKKFGFNNTENVTVHDFSIVVNTSNLLYGKITDPVTNPNIDTAYRIDPRSDRITIKIEDLDAIPPRTLAFTGGPADVNLSQVTFSQTRYGFPGLFPMVGGSYRNFTYNDGNLTPVNPPVDLVNNVTLIFEPGFFASGDDTGQIYINLTFGINQTAHPEGMPFLNNTGTRPFDYNHNPANVTQPQLRDGVMEVAVW